MQELLKQAKTRKNSMDYTDISILHTNDMHSYMENFPKKAQLIADIRARNEQKGIPTFVFDSGDLFSGNIFSICTEESRKSS